MNPMLAFEGKEESKEPAKKLTAEQKRLNPMAAGGGSPQKKNVIGTAVEIAAKATIENINKKNVLHIYYQS